MNNEQMDKAVWISLGGYSTRGKEKVSIDQWLFFKDYKYTDPRLRSAVQRAKSGFSNLR